MNRYLIFSEDSRKIIDECFDLAVDIWGGCYDDIRVLTGNYAGYGLYKARYHHFIKVIEIPFNDSFSDIYISNEGVDIKDNKKLKFMGTFIHELAHHYVGEYGKDLKLEFKAGYSTHTSKEWCYICAVGWKFFNQDLDVTPELLARGIRNKVEGLAEKMSRFSPYNPPIDILDNISHIDGHEKVCIQCSEIYISKRSDSKYCSSKCKLRFNRQLKKQANNSAKVEMCDNYLYHQFQSVCLEVMKEY